MLKRYLSFSVAFCLLFMFCGGVGIGVRKSSGTSPLGEESTNTLEKEKDAEFTAACDAAGRSVFAEVSKDPELFAAATEIHFFGVNDMIRLTYEAEGFTVSDWWREGRTNWLCA